MAEQSDTPRRGGPAPYGWRAERGRLIPVESEQAVRWLVLHLRRQGWSLPRIADELNTLGIRRHGQRLAVSTVHRITQRAAAAAELQSTG